MAYTLPPKWYCDIVLKPHWWPIGRKELNVMTLEELKTALLEGYDIGQESSLALIAIIEELRERHGWHIDEVVNRHLKELN